MLSLLLTALCIAITLLAWRHWWGWTPRHRIIAMSALLVLLCAEVIVAPSGLVLQKVFGALVMPVGLLWLAIAIAAATFWYRGRWSVAGLYTAFWFFFTCIGSSYVGTAWLWWLQADYREVRPFEEGPFDAILVLGGGTLRSPSGDATLSASGDRPILAARMYHAGLSPILVAAGESIEGIGVTRSSARETESIWRSLDIPESAILLLRGARNTSEEISGYQRLVAERGWTRVGLVSSAWHLRRALRLCASRGLQVQPLPADSLGAPDSVGLLSIIPSGDGFLAVHRAAWETLGALVGR